MEELVAPDQSRVPSQNSRVPFEQQMFSERGIEAEPESGTTKTPWSSLGIETKICATCKEEKPLSEYPCVTRENGPKYYRPHCWPCKYQTRDKGRDTTEYARSYYYHNKLDLKYKAYKHRDKVKFPDDITLSKESAVALMKEPCFYCARAPSHGLDRIDNTKGHTGDNVRPCCQYCNMILGDIPDAAKVLLVEGLSNIYRTGALGSWKIPTHR